jgi:alpha-tubulin suppressor-like RCC1 family protein
VSAHLKHTCGVKNDATVWCWGSNQYGELGDGVAHMLCGAADCSPTPVAVAGQVGVAGVSAGWHFSCSGFLDGTAWCWGRNTYGQLGDGGTTGVATPVRVLGISDVQNISAGGYHACVRTSVQTVWCWGLNRYGQLGDGGTHQTCGGFDCSPTAVHVSTLVNAASVAAGGVHTCALKSDGMVWCWGANYYGQLGDGQSHQTCEGSDCSPTPVMAGVFDVASISSGLEHSCAVKSDGRVFCWGSNSAGQLGDGGTHQDCNSVDCSPTPVQVSGLTDVVSVAAGHYHTCAVKSDGTAWCWGSNAGGRLGDGSFSDHPTPVQVSGLGGVQAISAGVTHGCALTNDGAAWCWGANLDGSLGDGGVYAESRVPVSVVDPY